MGSITCIAWKGDILVLGDVDGNLNFWDLKARVSRYECKLKSVKHEIMSIRMWNVFICPHFYSSL